MPGMRLATFEPAMPTTPNGSNFTTFWLAGEKSRPRRSSPKLPIRLTVERRWKNLPVGLVLPLSASTSDSSQKPALRPPPRSSTPRKPRRPVDRPPLFIVTLLDRLLFFT